MKKSGQQSSVGPRCHLMPGMPRDAFQNRLTYCLLCPETNPCCDEKGVSRHALISAFFLYVIRANWSGGGPPCGIAFVTSALYEEHIPSPKHAYVTGVYMVHSCEVAVKYKKKTEPEKEHICTLIRFLFIMYVSKNKNATCFASVPFFRFPHVLTLMNYEASELA